MKCLDCGSVMRWIGGADDEYHCPNRYCPSSGVHCSSQRGVYRIMVWIGNAFRHLTVTPGWLCCGRKEDT